MGVAEELADRARAAAPAGECAVTVENGELRLAVVLRPAVPMSHYMGILPVCALGALDALRPTRTGAALAWPGSVVLPGEDGHATTTLCSLEAHAGTGEAGMFVVCSAAVALAELGGAAEDELAQGLCSAIVARVDAWASDVAAGRGAAGPVAPVLSDYFDTLALMGHEADVVYPNGRVAAHGTFAAVDVWGRATVRLADGRELVISPEQASLR